MIKQKTSVKNDIKPSKNLDVKIDGNFDEKLDSKLDGNFEASASAELAKSPATFSAVEVVMESVTLIGGTPLLIDTAAELTSLPIKKNTEATKGFPLGIKKKILSRHSSCQYRAPKSDKLCGSTWFLQIDHKHSRWAGGNNELNNATVLCSRHNNLKYRNEAQIKVINQNI